MGYQYPTPHAGGVNASYNYGGAYTHSGAPPATSYLGYGTSNTPSVALPQVHSRASPSYPHISLSSVPTQTCGYCGKAHSPNPEFVVIDSSTNKRTPTCSTQCQKALLKSLMSRVANPNTSQVPVVSLPTVGTAPRAPMASTGYYAPPQSYNSGVVVSDSRAVPYQAPVAAPAVTTAPTTSRWNSIQPTFAPATTSYQYPGHAAPLNGQNNSISSTSLASSSHALYQQLQQPPRTSPYTPSYSYSQHTVSAPQLLSNHQGPVHSVGLPKVNHSASSGSSLASSYSKKSNETTATQSRPKNAPNYSAPTHSTSFAAPARVKGVETRKNNSAALPTAIRPKETVRVTLNSMDLQLQKWLDQRQNLPPLWGVRTVILDTNVLLDGSSPDVLHDLHRLSSDLTFIVPYVLVQELDALKARAHGPKYAARQAISRLFEMLVQGSKKEKWIRGQKPDERKQLEGTLQGTSGDDRILECLHYFHSYSPKGKRVLLLTHDKNLQLKTKLLGMSSASVHQVKTFFEGFEWLRKERDILQTQLLSTNAATSRTLKVPDWKLEDYNPQDEEEEEDEFAKVKREAEAAEAAEIAKKEKSEKKAQDASQNAARHADTLARLPAGTRTDLYDESSVESPSTSPRVSMPPSPLPADERPLPAPKDLINNENLANGFASDTSASSADTRRKLKNRKKKLKKKEKKNQKKRERELSSEDGPEMSAPEAKKKSPPVVITID